MRIKIITKLLALTLCAVLGITVAGAAMGPMYQIKEISEMEINVAPDMIAVTRDSQSTDAYFAKYNLDYNDVMKSMKDGNIYLQAMDSQQSVTVSVSMFENDDTRKISNYSSLTESELSDLVVSYKNNSGAATYVTGTVDEAVDNVRWIDFEVRATVGSAVIKQYQSNTVVNGQNVSITIQRNGADAVADDYAVLKGIVGTVKFTASPLPANLYLYIIIGAAVLLIVILIIIIIIAKRAGSKKKKNKNDKIIKELATKYTKEKSGKPQKTELRTEKPDSYVVKDREPEVREPERRADRYSGGYERRGEVRGSGKTYSVYDEETGETRQVRSFTDEEIDALLADLDKDKY